MIWSNIAFVQVFGLLLVNLYKDKNTNFNLKVMDGKSVSQASLVDLLLTNLIFVISSNYSKHHVEDLTNLNRCLSKLMIVKK